MWGEGPYKVRGGAGVGDVPDIDGCTGDTSDKFATGGETTVAEILTGETKGGDNFCGTRVPNGEYLISTQGEVPAIQGECEVTTEKVMSDFFAVGSVPLPYETASRYGHEVTRDRWEELDQGHTTQQNATGLPCLDIPQVNSTPPSRRKSNRGCIRGNGNGTNVVGI